MDLANRCTMLMAMKYRIKLFSITYAEWMLCQRIHPLSLTPRQIRSEINTLHDGRLHARFKDVVEDMRSRIPVGESPIGSCLQPRENAHMSCLHEINEIGTNMFGQPAYKEYIEETDTGDDPLQRQASQPKQLGMRFSSHMHEAPDEETQNSYSRPLRQEDQTAQHSVPNAENIALIRRLCGEHQAAQRSAAAM